MIMTAQTGTIISGRIISDPEKITFGAQKWPKTRFTVQYEGKNRSDSKIMRCEALFELADKAASFKKNDRVLVVGTMETFTGGDGNQRRVLVADFLTQMNAQASAETIDKANEIAANTLGKTQSSNQIDFSEINDEELPF